MHYTLQTVFEVHLGVPEAERAQKQEIVVSVDFEYETTKAQVSDDLGHTVDYQVIYDLLKSFQKDREWKLIEKLHADLKKALQEKFPEIQNLELTLQKTPWPDGALFVSSPGLTD